MSAVAQKGIKFFAHKANMSQDEALEYIIARYKTEGYGIWILLLERIYSQEGYYMIFNEKAQWVFSGKYGVDQPKLMEIVNEMLSMGLFNKELFEKYQILTSDKVQTTYIYALTWHRKVDFNSNYLLVDVAKTAVEAKLKNRCALFVDGKPVRNNDSISYLVEEEEAESSLAPDTEPLAPNTEPLAPEKRCHMVHTNTDTNTDTNTNTKTDTETNTETETKTVKKQKERKQEVSNVVELHPLNAWIKTCCPKVFKLETQMTPEQCEIVLRDYEGKKIKEVLLAMENYKKLSSNYSSVYLTLLNWLKRRENDDSASPYAGQTYRKPLRWENPDLMQELLNTTRENSFIGDINETNIN